MIRARIRQRPVLPGACLISLRQEATAGQVAVWDESSPNNPRQHNEHVWMWHTEGARRVFGNDCDWVKAMRKRTQIAAKRTGF